MILVFLTLGFLLAARSNSLSNITISLSYENPQEFLIEKTDDQNYIYIERNAQLEIRCLPKLPNSSATWNVDCVRVFVRTIKDNMGEASLNTVNTTVNGMASYQHTVKAVDQIYCAYVYNKKKNLMVNSQILTVATAEEVKLTKTVITSNGTNSSSVRYMDQLKLKCFHDGQPKSKTFTWWVKYPGEGDQWMTTYLEGPEVTTDPIAYEKRQHAQVQFMCKASNFVTKAPYNMFPTNIVVNNTGIVSSEYVPNPKYYSRLKTARPSSPTIGSATGLNPHNPTSKPSGSETNMSTVVLASIISVPLLAIILIAFGIIFGVVLARKRRRHPKLPAIPVVTSSTHGSHGAPSPFPRTPERIQGPNIHTYCDMYETILPTDNSTNDDYLIPTMTSNHKLTINTNKNADEVRYSSRQSKEMYSYADSDLARKGLHSYETIFNH